ncbi:MAG: Franean1_4349 family RiPP [Anaerolineae bacterium]|nr:Franean1_4349 family RiPP [Anaerolineae bacterium]MCO5246550.1 Franean1_4349 family RiPP [Anaerolineae bacterium]
MSQQAIETILGKAVLEDEFRSTLLSDADSALAGYELTAAESAALKGMDVEALENLAGALDQRISKSIPFGVMWRDGVWVDPVDPIRNASGGDVSNFYLLRHVPEGA